MRPYPRLSYKSGVDGTMFLLTTMVTEHKPWFPPFLYLETVCKDLQLMIIYYCSPLKLFLKFKEKKRFDFFSIEALFIMVIFRLLLFSGSILTVYVFIFILYRMVMRHSRQVNLWKTMTCTDNGLIVTTGRFHKRFHAYSDKLSINCT